MEDSRFLQCLAADYGDLRDAASAAELTATVPSCPGWTVSDLVRHVAEVYLHKVTLMRTGEEPEEWPPPSLAAEAPLAALGRAYGALRAEFRTRGAGQAAPTWYGPDQTVGFWIRRMAQETVIHRIDAELACGALVAPIPDDLAIDGVDELLKIFVGWAYSQWPEDFADALKDSPGHSYAIRIDSTEDSHPVTWLVKTAPDQLTAAGGPDEESDGTATADVTKELLNWSPSGPSLIEDLGQDHYYRAA